jgi:hypothetical protein
MQSAHYPVPGKAWRPISQEVCLAISLCLCGAMCGPADHGSRDTANPPLEISRIVRIPVLLLGDLQREQLPPNQSRFLAISPGSEDELPEGPSAFEVLDDGGFIISDPLLNRMVVYDGTGNFKRAFHLGFAADEVIQLENGALRVRRATTDLMYQLDSNGSIRPLDREMRIRPDVAGAGIARRVALDHGIVADRMQGHERITDPLDIHYRSDTTQMVALQSLASSVEGFTFVSLTVNVQGADAVKTKTFVRKYSRKGELLCQTAECPGDYYVYPANPLRVRNNMIYQMIPGKDVVTINIWNTSEYN